MLFFYESKDKQPIVIIVICNILIIPLLFLIHLLNLILLILINDLSGFRTSSKVKKY